MEAISIKNLEMKYTDSDFALRDIDLTIDEGDFVVLTGGTGSGKSTLLRQLKREFARKYTGSIKVLGKEMRDLSIKDTLDIGYVMQFVREQIVTDKVFHELSFGLENMGLSKDEIRLRVSETASYFGLSGYMDKKTNELSGGEMQLLNLASVMAMRPRILLLDEPTSQLDEVASEKFLSFIYRINRELGTTIVIAEHRLDMLDRFTRVVIMDDGAITYNGDEPKGYDELPIYMRVGEVLDRKIGNVVECRDAIRELRDEGKISDKADVHEEAGKRKSVLTVHDVWHRYTKRDKDVLKGVDIDVYEGEIFAIVGGNGAGKSTLLSIISGVLPCYKGSVKNYGNKVVYIPQNPSFIEESVAKEIDNSIKLYVRAYRDMNRKKKPSTDEIENYRQNLVEKAKKYEEIFDLQKLEKSHPNEISGGEKAKLAILIGLLASPKVLLLDEPTKGLDRAGKTLIKGCLASLTALKASVILVSHDIELIYSVSDRVATLFDGEIVSICTPRLLLETNYLFTTTSSRITRGIVEGIVSEDDLLEAVRDVR